MKAPFQIAPPDYHENDFAAVRAIQAVAAGKASEVQQQLAMRWIIERACMYYDLGFSPESERLSAFAEGRRFVGAQIVKLIKLPIGQLQEKEKQRKSQSRDK